jgi:ATP-binding cassette subfamily B protein
VLASPAVAFAAWPPLLSAMRLLIGYLRPHRNLVILALVLAAINQIFSLLDPAIFRHVISDYAARPERFTTDHHAFLVGVSQLFGLMVGAAFVSRVAKNFQDYCLNVITQRVGARLYADGIQHSLSVPFAVFEDQRSGETLGKLQKVRADVEKFISAFVNIIFTTVVGILFVMVYSFRIHWAIAPAYFATVPLLALLSSVLSRRVKTIQKQIVAETTALAGSTTESLRNIELLKSLGLADQEITRLNAVTDRILALELKKVRYIRSLSFIQGTCVNLMRTLILFLMSYLVLAGKMDVGQLVALMIYSFFIFGPMQEIGNIVTMFRETEASLAKFQEILDTPLDRKPEHPVSVQDLKELAFEHVSFTHQTATGPALSDVSFRADRGETLAFVGPSGSGKTTLVKLLVGLYQPAQGRILYNNVDNSHLDLDRFRERIGLVTQDAQLFSGSIRENLLFVKPDATDQECIDVLHKAAAMNLLRRADKGLDTVIGEGGMKISGGEKQRLSIARALLRQPHLLVFDEATSALDSLTEEEITRTIRVVSAGRNVITVLIAHRLSTVMHADRIHVLERGKVIEVGHHDELLALKGLYYAMWRQQVGERRLPAREGEASRRLAAV